MENTKDILTSYILSEFLPGESASSLQDDTALRPGVVDSIGLIKLIAFVEGQFGIEIEPLEAVDSNFSPLKNLVAFVEEKRKGLE